MEKKYGENEKGRRIDIIATLSISKLPLIIYIYKIIVHTMNTTNNESI